ncbi:MAG: class I SAM-dependent methyltransferase [Solirubrobacteraceae bacterium]
MARRNTEANRLAADALEIVPGSRVLDIGCGPGVGVRIAADRAGTGQAAGADPSAVMVRQARRRLRGTGCVVVQAPAERLPFPDHSFDGVSAVNSAGHWESLDAGLREVRRVLVPGGHLVLVLRLHDANAGRASRAAYGLRPERLERLRASMRAAGFEIVSEARREVDGEQALALRASAPQA